MADKDLSKQEKQRLKEKEKFERERKKWKQQESKKRVKKTRKKDRTGVWIKTLAIVVAVAVVLSVVSIYAGSFGVPGRFMPALTVGSQNVTAPEWAYNFNKLYRDNFQDLMYSGMDTNVTLFGQPTQDGTSWDMVFRRLVNQSLQNELALYNEAKKAGYQLPQESLDALDEAMKELDDVAKMYAMSTGAYLRNNYVPGITKAKYRALEERRMTVQGFAVQKQEEFRGNHPEEELEKKYKEDPDAYHQVDYRIYQFPIEQMEEIEGESAADKVLRQVEAEQAAKAEAEDFLREGRTQEGFIAAAQKLYDAQHQHEEDEEVDHAHDYDADSATLNLRRTREDIQGSYGNDEFAAWFFEAGRAAGNTTIWQTDSSVYAVYLVRPSYAQTTVNFYTINVDIAEHEHEEGEEHEDDEPTPQEKAKKSADELLAQWQEDGGTQEAFVALVNARASVAEAQEDGQPGLTEKAAPNDFPELESWLFDPARKPGDAEVIETSDSFKVIYLASQNADSFAWQREIADMFVQEDYTAYVEELHEQYPMGHHGIGIRFALANAQKMCDEFMEYQKSQMNNSIDYSAYGL